MRLKLYNCDNNDISLLDNVLCLEVLPRGIFYNMLLDFSCPTIPSRELAILDNDKFVKESDILVISDFLNFDLANKTLLNKIYKYIERKVISNFSEKIDFDENVSNFKKVLDNIISDIDIDFSLSDSVDIKSLLSIFNLVPYVEDSILSKLLQIINISAELGLYKIIVLVQAKAYLSNEDLHELYKYSLYKKVPLIIIENNYHKIKIKNEKKLFIDEEFCDIIE